MAWSMWFMGYGPGDQGVQRTLELAVGNATFWEQGAGDAMGGPAGNGAVTEVPTTTAAAWSPPDQPSRQLSACPLAAWSAHWLMLSHGVPAVPRPLLERRCAPAMLPAQYGAEGAAFLRRSGIVRLGNVADVDFSAESFVAGAPMRLAINRAWDAPPRGGKAGDWRAPAAPLWAVPLNQTAVHAGWQAMAEATDWMSKEAPEHIKLLKKEAGRRRARRRGRAMAGEEGGEEGWSRHHAFGLTATLRGGGYDATDRSFLSA